MKGPLFVFGPDRFDEALVVLNEHLHDIEDYGAGHHVVPLVTAQFAIIGIACIDVSIDEELVRRQTMESPSEWRMWWTVDVVSLILAPFDDEATEFPNWAGRCTIDTVDIDEDCPHAKRVGRMPMLWGESHEFSEMLS